MMTMARSEGIREEPTRRFVPPRLFLSQRRGTAVAPLSSRGSMPRRADRDRRRRLLPTLVGASKPLTATTGPGSWLGFLGNNSES